MQVKCWLPCAEGESWKQNLVRRRSRRLVPGEKGDEERARCSSGTGKGVREAGIQGQLAGDGCALMY